METRVYPAQVAKPEGGARHSGALVPTLAIALAALLWAVAAVLARELFDAGVPPIQLVEARAFVSALGLALLPAAWRRRPGGSDRNTVLVVIGLGLSIALVNAAYYAAISRLAVAVAIVLQYLGPAFVVAWVALRERMTPSGATLAALAVAFAGVVLVSELPSGDFGSVDGLGLAAGLASALFFAAYTLQSERAATHYGSVGALFRAFAAASLLWIVYQAPQGLPHELFEPENFPKVVFVGLVGTLAPFLLYIWAVQRLRAERAVITATLEPFFAGLVAWLWLDQVLSALQVVGAALILAGVVWVQIRSGPVPGSPDAPLSPERI